MFTHFTPGTRYDSPSDRCLNKKATAPTGAIWPRDSRQQSVTPGSGQTLDWKFLHRTNSRCHTLHCANLWMHIFPLNITKSSSHPPPPARISPKYHRESHPLTQKQYAEHPCSQQDCLGHAASCPVLRSLCSMSWIRNEAVSNRWLPICMRTSESTSRRS